MLTASTRLGPYEIVASIGAGGMGEVYRARDTRLGRDVAVKVLLEPFANNPDRQSRFEREAKAVAALSHPNILSIHDYGTHEGVTYAVMELLEGETLRSRLKKGPLPWRGAVEIGAAIAEGMAAAHAKGIIHRDLKPENLFLTADGRVKVLDFGLARMAPVPASQSETSPYVPAETEAGTVMGTVGYMSPEQVRGQSADAPSDLFSFGCVMYEMVTGQRAFQRETAAETMTAILHDEPPDLTNSSNPMPAELGRLMRQCLAKNPHQRLHSARDLALALRATASDPGLQQAAPRRMVEAVAVLPFENVGGDPKTEYLSDGVADQLIISLSQVSRDGLKVRPFTSVSRYKRQPMAVLTIGRELNVQVLVTGTLHQVGDDLWISVAVVDAGEDNQLWGKRYQGGLSEILDVQDQIARDVAANLRLRLTGEEEQRLTKRYTEDPEAYLLYREAIYHWNKFTQEGLNTAIEYCNRALSRDANYALAYVGLAQCHVLLGNLYVGPRATFGEARRCAKRALGIDDRLQEAHTFLGAVYLFHDWNWASAERELKQGAMRSDAHTSSLTLYGFYLAAMGRLPEALDTLRREQEIDPRRPAHRNELAMCHNWLRQYDRAIPEAQKAIELDANFQFAYAELATAYVQMGMAKDAIAALEAALKRGQLHPRVQGTLGYAYATAGEKAAAQRVLAEMTRLAPGRFGFALPIARIHAALDDTDRAFEWLQKACDERDSYAIWVKVDPTLDNLRSDPRFAQVLREMGLPPENETPLPPPPTRRSSRWVAWALTAVVLAALVGATAYLIRKYGQGPDSGKPPEEVKAIEAVAVLPFENVGDDPKTEYLSEGIPDTIIHGLSRLRLRDLKVQSLISVARYKGLKPDLSEIRRELGVGVIVTGRLQQRGDSLSVSVALIDVRDGRELWGNQYERKLDNILALQDQIAKDIAANLRLRLTGEEERRLTKRGTENPEAHQLYLKGRYFWNKRTPEGINKARLYFEQAIDKDPSYALAYAGLADCYVVRVNLLPPKESMPKARAAAMTALELDDTLAEAHTTLARVLTIYDWNWSGAKKEFERAIDLNPRYAVAHQWYGQYWAALGRSAESIAGRKQAQQLDPLSVMINFELATAFYHARQYEQAIEEFRKTLEMDPSFALAHTFLSAAYEQMGMYEKAITGFQKAISLSSDRSASMAGLGHVYAVSGKKDEARKVLNELKQMSEHGGYVPAHDIALIYAGLGEADQAFAWLEKAYLERSFGMVWLKTDPRWENLRTDSRFADLLWRMGLADKAAERDQGIHSVAVLPFKNVSGDPKTEYLSDGVAEQIINSLSQVRYQDLRVRPFTSVARYRGKVLDIQAFGRELSVQMLVTGTLRQDGDKLSISVSVVDVQQESQIWGERYPDKPRDAILDLQDKIARDVAANLRLRLTGEEEQRLTKRNTEDPEAYLLYREANYHFNKFTEAGLETAVDYCQRALKKDANYALAYVGLARGYIVLGTIHRGPRQTFAEARKYLAKASSIDNTLADAHVAQGVIYLMDDWDWPAAKRELEKAIAMDPHEPLACEPYGLYLAAMNRLPEALASFRRGLELDPLAAPRRYDLAMGYNWMRQYNEAIAEAQKALELDPNFPLAYADLGMAYVQKRMYDEAIAKLGEALNRGHTHPRVRGMLGYAYAAAGRRAEAQKVLEEMKRLSQGRFAFALPIARIHAALGETDQAFEWLQKSCDERDSAVIWIKVDPTLDNLRSDPRFAEKLKEMKLPP